MDKYTCRCAKSYQAISGICLKIARFPPVTKAFCNRAGDAGIRLCLPSYPVMQRAGAKPGSALGGFSDKRRPRCCAQIHAPS